MLRNMDVSFSENNGCPHSALHDLKIVTWDSAIERKKQTGTFWNYRRIYMILLRAYLLSSKQGLF